MSSIFNDSSSIDLQADELWSVFLYYGVLFWVHRENECHNMCEEGEFVVDGLSGGVHRGLIIQICQYPDAPGHQRKHLENIWHKE